MGNTGKFYQNWKKTRPQIPCVPPVVVVDEEVVSDGDAVGDGAVCLMDSGSTIKPPKLVCCAAVFRSDITSFTPMLWLNGSTRSTITLPHLKTPTRSVTNCTFQFSYISLQSKLISQRFPYWVFCNQLLNISKFYYTYHLFISVCSFLIWVFDSRIITESAFLHPQISWYVNLHSSIESLK